MGFSTLNPPRFDEEKENASDTKWLHDIEQEQIIIDELLFFWLSHNKNISNPEKKIIGKSSINKLKAKVGKFWGDTDIWLSRLSKQEATGKK